MLATAVALVSMVVMVASPAWAAPGGNFKGARVGMADRTFAKAKSWPELHAAHARWACMGMSAPPCTRAVRRLRVDPPPGCLCDAPVGHGEVGLPGHAVVVGHLPG
jgi:hypothetical protein